MSECVKFSSSISRGHRTYNNNVEKYFEHVATVEPLVDAIEQLENHDDIFKPCRSRVCTPEDGESVYDGPHSIFLLSVDMHVQDGEGAVGATSCCSDDAMEIDNDVSVQSSAAVPQQERVSKLREPKGMMKASEAVINWKSRGLGWWPPFEQALHRTDLFLPLVEATTEVKALRYPIKIYRKTNDGERVKIVEGAPWIDLVRFACCSDTNLDFSGKSDIDKTQYLVNTGSSLHWRDDLKPYYSDGPL